MNRFFGLLLLICLVCATTATAAEQKIRLWSDVTGKHTMKASYVSNDDETVTLKDPEGETFEVKLRELSVPDRAYIKLIPRGQPTPPESDSDNADEPSVIGVTKVRGEAIDVRPPDDGWSFAAKPNSKLAFTPKQFNVSLKEFGEHQRDFIVTPSGRFGAITTMYSGQHTRISIVDLSRRRVIGTSAAEGDYVAIAVSDDGKRVAIRSNKFGEKREVGVFRVSGKTLKRVGAFTPFPEQHDADVQWAAFVGDNQLAVLCEEAGVSVWDLSSFKEDCYFELDGHCAATRNVDGSVIAFVDSEKVGLFRVAERAFQGVQPVPSGLWVKQMAFSPSEQRLVAFAIHRIVAWDTATGDVISDIPDLKLPPGKIDCVQENYVLLGNKFLVDIENQLKLWTYNGMHQTASAGGVTFFAIKRGVGRGSSLAIVPVSLPDADASRALKAALAQPDVFLLKSGGTVRLDVSKVPEAHRDKVRTDIVSQLLQNNITVSDDGVSTLTASISSPQSVKATYYSRKDRVPHTYSFKVMNSKAELLHDGKSVWSRQSDNQPSSVYPKEGRSVQEELSHHTQKPNLFFFKHLHLPKLIQKEPEKQGPGLMWTFGESVVD